MTLINPTGKKILDTVELIIKTIKIIAEEQQSSKPKKENKNGKRKKS
jgi:hypothetical protein